MQTEDEMAVARAAERLSRPGAWLMERDGGYRVLCGPDRRRRPLMVLEPAVFAALCAEPGLTPLPGGGWRLARLPRVRRAAPEAGRPGVVEGERYVTEVDGAVVARRANLGGSALAWLASRRDANGRPWLEPRHLAAAERLELDHERSGQIGRLTMRWDAGPRGSPGAPGLDPAERGRAARRRLAAALDALSPREGAVVERVVLYGEPLTAVERRTGLTRRSAKLVLRDGLEALAAHYRL